MTDEMQTTAKDDEDAQKVADLAARNPKMLEFARWCMSDPTNRKPKTQQEWAGANGVAQSTLSRWKRDQLFLGILKGWKDELRPLTANVATALYKQAVNGDVKAIRAWMELMGEFPKQQLEISTTVPDLASILSGAEITPQQRDIFVAWLKTQTKLPAPGPYRGRDH